MDKTTLKSLIEEFKPSISQGLNEKALPIIDAKKLEHSSYAEEQTLILDYIFMVKTAFLQEVTYAFQLLSLGSIKISEHIKKLEVAQYIESKTTKYGKAIILTAKGHQLIKDASKTDIRACSDNWVKEDILAKRKLLNKLFAFRVHMMTLLTLDAYFYAETESFQEEYGKRNGKCF